MIKPNDREMEITGEDPAYCPEAYRLAEYRAELEPSLTPRPETGGDALAFVASIIDHFNKMIHYLKDSDTYDGAEHQANWVLAELNELHAILTSQRQREARFNPIAEIKRLVALNDKLQANERRLINELYEAKAQSEKVIEGWRVRPEFIASMEHELMVNTPKKGNFSDFKTTRVHALGWLQEHVDKLIMAIVNNSKPKIKEHTADVANIVMKIDECLGQQSSKAQLEREGE